MGHIPTNTRLAFAGALYLATTAVGGITTAVAAQDGAAITVIARDAAGRPLSGVAITMYGFDSVPSPRRDAATDSLGVVTVGRLSPGEYSIFATCWGMFTGSARPRVEPGARDTVRITMRPFDGPILRARKLDLAGDTISTYADIIEPAVLAGGLPSLRRTPLPSGTREIRLWVCCGILVPNTMLRLVQRNGVVSGEILSSWPPVPAGYTNRFLREVDSMSTEHARTHPFCSKIHRHFDSTMTPVEIRLVCTSKTTRDRIWAVLWQQLDSLGVWTLPDVTEVDRYELMMFDGVGFAAEVRDGAHYRTYSYGNSGDLQPVPEAAAMREMNIRTTEALGIFYRALPPPPH